MPVQLSVHARVGGAKRAEAYGMAGCSLLSIANKKFAFCEDSTLNRSEHPTVCLRCVGLD